jgi:PadR family transcriptional regulator, regulatory protein PadR
VVLIARPAGEPRNFLQCCVLLLLRERPAHGYELLERLKSFGLADGDPGNVYRRLRSLERQGMLRSRWEPSEAGPRRRTYYLTDRGETALGVWAGVLAETRGLLDYYLGRHASICSPHPRVPAEPGGRAP